MVCQRCISAVEEILCEEGLTVQQVTLGEALIGEKRLSDSQSAELDHKLKKAGFERIDDFKSQIINKVKSVVINSIHHYQPKANLKWSEIIKEDLPYDYRYLSQLFSSVEGITIEQYIIRQKVEKAKELIIYDQESLSEIAYRLGYSSIPHFSSQFKKVTGMTPSEFRNLSNPRRKSIDQI